MTIVLGYLNLVLGLVYTSYGVLTAMDVRRHTATRGLSHFGLAWIAMAFTCGPHHLVHGVHLALEGRQVGMLELATVLVGYPAGIIWFLLRLEAAGGGRGDRHIRGTPRWLTLLAVGFGVLALASYVAFVPVALQGVAQSPELIPNLLLVAAYIMTGLYVGRGQLDNRPELQGWSLSGLMLAVIFPTCAMMHGAYAMYVARGIFTPDVHGLWVDWLAVPAAIYFLWVVRSLYLGTLEDWNTSAGNVTAEADRGAVAAG